VDDWVRAAFEIMIDHGIAGVKIHLLCERLGVTKGSFYWHFADLDAFHQTLIDRFRAEAANVPEALGAHDPQDADAALLHVMSAFANKRNRELSRAMRTWAETDPRAAAAMKTADGILLERVTEAIVSVGFDEEEAEVRAKILYYAGIGFAHVGALGKKTSPAAELEATWRIITTR
jgi:AcrR family transcriptional regulator